MRFAPFTCSSIGVATDCSTVSASAPVYIAVVWICGGAISGNCATGSRKTITAPPITKTSAMTIATIGLLMKNLDMALSFRRLRRSGLLGHRSHRDPVLDVLQPLGNDAFAGAEPLVDD